MTKSPKCDRPKCPNAAAWRYRVATLVGVGETLACQADVRAVRAFHGMNILGVEPVR